MTAKRHSDFFLWSVLLLAAAWPLLGGAVRGPAAVIALGGVVLLLGLPHGALDLWLARRDRLWSDWPSFAVFHLAYIALAGLVVLAFVASPLAALLGFLVFSVWHFSDDWRHAPLATRLGCAGAVVIVPALSHPAAVSGIFSAVTGEPVALEGLPPALAILGAFAVLGAIASAFAFDRRMAAEAAGVALLAVALPPLVFFAVYFTLLHSPRHLLRHRGELRRGVGSVLLYTLAALAAVIALGALLWRFAPADLSDSTIRAVFIGLAALSVPHGALIEFDRRAAQRGLPLFAASANPRP
ncbi:Brp/Blh family beta-carotene 15,15'-dioxygenase [Parvularcula oceani]|uniref:Brp/Blh family beta-carotene 15,15'-dioxygenase n=1 Tax=Parvularcula oceani TaxID=1247963 RepID=UPI00068D7C82|nr:Brp/Blh family beta-carotene 15,15'-dioxygenase [Parvularcula oceani]